MKSDGTLACTMCQHCGQPSNWTHDDGSCPRCGKQRTPPIAQPPAAVHVERRAGHDKRPVTMLQPDPASNELIKQLQKHIDDAYRLMVTPRWLVPSRALADAPPEPAKPACTCGAGPGDTREHSAYCPRAPKKPAQEAPKFRDVLCSGGCGLRICLVSPLTWTCPTCVRKRTEAPKAAPVCSECDHAQPNVCMRVTREARELLCDICMTRKEEQVIDLMGQEPRTVPYKGPTRLPRPQLAADWVEDCLATVWR